MIPLEEAVAHVLAGCHPLPPRTVPLAAAAGLVLAGDVVATEAVPPFANTAMDGYAVRAADTAGAPVVLPVVAEVAAGPCGSRSRPGRATTCGRRARTSGPATASSVPATS